MDRRAFIGGLAGGLLAMPLAARGQPAAKPVIGFLHFASPGPNAPYVAAFRQGLGETGYVEGQNVAIEYRWAEGMIDRLPALAADLVGRRVDVIAALGPPSARAAKNATSTLPIVFAVGTDPVADGLVTNLARPGGNLTGIAAIATAPGIVRARPAARRCARPGGSIKTPGAAADTMPPPKPTTGPAT